MLWTSDHIALGDVCFIYMWHYQLLILNATVFLITMLATLYNYRAIVFQAACLCVWLFVWTSYGKDIELLTTGSKLKSFAGIMLNRIHRQHTTWLAVTRSMDLVSSFFITRLIKYISETAWSQMTALSTFLGFSC